MSAIGCLQDGCTDVPVQLGPAITEQMHLMHARPYDDVLFPGLPKVDIRGNYALAVRQFGQDGARGIEDLRTADKLKAPFSQALARLKKSG